MSPGERGYKAIKSNTIISQCYKGPPASLKWNLKSGLIVLIYIR